MATRASHVEPLEHIVTSVPGEWHSTWVMWSPTWEFEGWYVNFEEPLRRTRQGFDVRDLQLDIFVGPDLRWRWKDETEFERALASGLVSEVKAETVRRSAAAAIEAIGRRAWPFDPEVASWRPDAWAAASLPTGEALGEARSWPAGLHWEAAG